jgi:hypothetical protein
MRDGHETSTEVFTTGDRIEIDDEEPVHLTGGAVVLMRGHRGTVVRVGYPQAKDPCDYITVRYDGVEHTHVVPKYRMRRLSAVDVLAELA